MPKTTLEQIADLMIEEKRIASQLQLLVNDARAQGSSWQRIGDAAGISKQVAHKRWTDKGRQKNRDYHARLRRDARGELPFDPAEATKFRTIRPRKSSGDTDSN